jgi:hypothetical protein
MGVTPRQLLDTVMMGCFVAALFGADPLVARVDASVAGGTVVQQAADGWRALTQLAGFDRPYDVLRHAVREVVALSLRR